MVGVLTGWRVFDRCFNGCRVTDPHVGHINEQYRNPKKSTGNHISILPPNDIVALYDPASSKRIHSAENLSTHLPLYTWVGCILTN